MAVLSLCSDQHGKVGEWGMTGYSITGRPGGECRESGRWTEERHVRGFQAAGVVCKSGHPIWVKMLAGGSMCGAVLLPVPCMRRCSCERLESCTSCKAQSSLQASWAGVSSWQALERESPITVGHAAGLLWLQAFSHFLHHHLQLHCRHGVLVASPVLFLHLLHHRK